MIKFIENYILEVQITIACIIQYEKENYESINYSYLIKIHTFQNKIKSNQQWLN